MTKQLAIAVLGTMLAAGAAPALADNDAYHHATPDKDGHYGQHWSAGHWVPNNGNGWHDGKHYAYGVYDNNGHRINHTDHDRDDRRRHHPRPDR